MDPSLSYYFTATTIGLFTISLLSLYLFRTFKSTSQCREEAPLVSGAWPILGHLPLLSSSQKTHVTLGTMADTYGPIFTIKLGSTKGLVISNWEMAKECFTTNDVAVSSRPQLIAIDNLTYNRALLGFAPYGPYWREIRKITTSEFLSNHRIDLISHVLEPIVQTSTKKLFQVWSNREDKNENFVLVELMTWLGELTFNIVRQMVIGKKCCLYGDDEESDASRIVKGLRDLMHHFGVFTVSDAVPLLRWLDLGGHERAMKETAKKWDIMLSGWLEEHRRKWTSREEVKSDQDFMDAILSRIDGRMIHGHDADSITKATTLALIAGSIDPTTVTLTWAMSLMLNNPSTLRKVKEELHFQIGVERFVTYSDLNKLVYLQAVVKETLRLYPANPLLSPRSFTEDCIIGGYYVKKGTRLITNLWKIHTDSNIWSDPFEFKPERFLTTDKNVDVKGHHFELFPFGSGRRMCPGISFSLRIIHLILANFLHSFDISVPSSETIDMTESVGLTNTKATPLEVLIKPRLSPRLYEK